MLFWSGARSSAADPGADRCFSTVTPTINERVTLLKERILFFFVRAGDSTGGCIREGKRGCGLLAKAQATARVDVPTAKREFIVFCVILNSFMSVLPVHEPQKSQSGEGGPS